MQIRKILFFICTIIFACLFLFTGFRLKRKEEIEAVRNLNPVESVGFVCGNRNTAEAVGIYTDESSGCWNIYLAGDLKNEGVRLVCSKFISVVMHGRTFQNGDFLPVEDYDVLVEAKINNEYGLSEEGKLRFIETSPLSCVFINLESENGEDEIQAQRGVTASGEIITVFPDGSIDNRSLCSVGIHGYTSWNEAKKSYNIKLLNAASLLEMSNQ